MKRSLKVEARMEDGRKYVIPYLRMRGKWLERMGFPPDRHVEVSMIEPGLIEIRLKPEGKEKQTGTDIDRLDNGGSDRSSFYSLDHCLARIEQLKHECRSAFTSTWRHRCGREIAEWDAYVAKHYPEHRRSKTGDRALSRSSKTVRKPPSKVGA